MATPNRPTTSPTMCARIAADLPLTKNGSNCSSANTVRERRTTSSEATISPGARLPHQPRGEVHRIALDGERAPVRRAEVAREHRPAVDPDPQRKRDAGVHDRADGAQHPLLVVARASRRAREQEDLAAVLRDVCLVEGHTVLLDRPLNRTDALVECERDRFPTPLADQRRRCRGIRRTRHRSSGARARGRLRAGGCGSRPAGTPRSEGRRCRRRSPLERADAAGSPLSRKPGPFAAPTFRGRQPRGGSRRDDDLTRVGIGFQQRRLGRCATGDQKLAVALADEEEVEHTGVHSDRHPQDDRARLGANPADAADCALHLGGAATGPCLVFVTVVEQEHRVATPLDHTGAVVVRNGEQLGERRVEGVAQLLGATFPFFASRSASFVKPEMSTKTNEPSTGRYRTSGVVRSQSTTSRGTYGSKASWACAQGSAFRSLHPCASEGTTSRGRGLRRSVFGCTAAIASRFAYS